MEFIIVFILGLFAADQAGMLDKPDPEPTPVVEVKLGPEYIVEDKPIYKPDHYYKDESGDYYITDLSTQPVQPPQTEQLQ